MIERSIDQIDEPEHKLKINRDQIINIRATRKEKEEIQKCAEAEGSSVSEYVRHKCLGLVQKPASRPTESLKMQNDRMFKFLDHYVVAPTMDEALTVLSLALLDDRRLGPDGIYTLTQYESEYRGFENPLYDTVLVDEYLHAVPPEDLLEIPLSNLPVGWGLLQPEHAHPDCIGGVVICEARILADNLPSGCHINMVP